VLLVYLSYLQDRFRKDDRGATAVEYGLLIAGIAALIIGAVFAFGPAIAGLFEGIADQLGGAGADAGAGG
jgi:pilus assembly protein Flp/PilA